MKYPDKIEHEEEVLEVRFFTKDGRIRAIGSSVKDLSSNKVLKIIEYFQSTMINTLKEEGYIDSDV